MMYRLMSGLRSVADDGTWQPAGAPTAVKLVEALDKSRDELDLVFYPADPGEIQTFRGEIQVKGLSSRVTILDYGLLMSKLPCRARLFLAPLWRAVWSLWHVLRTTPDIFYTDRGNVIAGSVIARTTSVKTVLRILGVPPSLWSIFEGNRLIRVLTRFSFRAPFSLVIGTKDGSRIDAFFAQALGNKVPWLLRTNGVNKEVVQNTPTSDLLKLVFLGRLEPLKGAQDVLDAIVELPDEKRTRLCLTFIGDGSLENKMRTSVANAGLQKQIKFTGAIEHKHVLQHLCKNDMYISLNEQGQISNANLEAVTAGLGFILSNTLTGNDKAATALWRKDMAIWIDRNNLKKNLQDTIVRLLDNPEEIERKKCAAKQLSYSLDSWKERISWEVALLQNLANGIFLSSDWQAHQNAQT